MARVRQRYYRGDPLPAIKIPLYQSTDNSLMFVQRDGIHVNGFSDLKLYLDAAGASPLPNGSYEEVTADADWTASEVGFTNKTVYSQYRIIDGTYWNVDIYADFTDFGVYTDVDAEYAMVGVQSSVASSGTFTPSQGATCEMLTVDTSIGNVALTVDAPVFNGQSVDIICDGTGYVDVTFPGQESTAPVRVTNGKKLSLKGKSGGDWIADSGVTADYVVGDENIIFESTGEMKIIGKTSASAVVTLSITYSVPFVSRPFVTALLAAFGTGDARAYIEDQSSSNTDETKVRFLFQSTTQTSSQLTYKSEGKY